MIALALVQALFPPVPGERWQTDITYDFRSTQYPSDTQLWKWRESYEMKPTGDILVSRVLIENLLDGKQLPLVDGSVPDVWIIKDPLKKPVRDPGLDDPATFRLWRLVQVPYPGTSLSWQGSQKWPSASASCSPVKEPLGARNAVTFEFSEPGGMKGKGSGFCSSDGILRSGTMKVENAFLPGGDYSAQRLEITWRPPAK